MLQNVHQCCAGSIPHVHMTGHLCYGFTEELVASQLYTLSPSLPLTMLLSSDMEGLNMPQPIFLTLDIHVMTIAACT